MLRGEIVAVSEVSFRIMVSLKGKKREKTIMGRYLAVALIRLLMFNTDTVYPKNTMCFKLLWLP